MGDQAAARVLVCPCGWPLPLDILPPFGPSRSPRLASADDTSAGVGSRGSTRTRALPATLPDAARVPFLNLPFDESYLDGLRALLTRMDVADCDCPLDLACPCAQSCETWAHDTCPVCLAELGGSPGTGETCAAHCPHCNGSCSCPPCDYQPPCRHALREVDPADEFELGRLYAKICPGRPTSLAEMIAALRKRAYPDEYAEPEEDLPDSTCWDRESRVAKMEERAALGLHVENPLDRWRRRESSVGVEAARARNGSVYEKELRRA